MAQLVGYDAKNASNPPYMFMKPLKLSAIPLSTLYTLRVQAPVIWVPFFKEEGAE